MTKTCTKCGGTFETEDETKNVCPACESQEPKAEGQEETPKAEGEETPAA